MLIRPVCRTRSQQEMNLGWRISNGEKPWEKTVWAKVIPRNFSDDFLAFSSCNRLTAKKPSPERDGIGVYADLRWKMTSVLAA